MKCALESIFITDPRHRISEVGRYLWKSLRQNPCSSQLQVYQGCCLTRFLTSLRRRLHHLPKTLDALFNCPNTKKIFFSLSRISHISLLSLHISLLSHVLSLGPSRRVWLYLLYAPYQVFVYSELHCLVLTAVMAPPKFTLPTNFFFL